MEAFILSWVFPVLLLITISCITFLLVKKYMDKKIANIVFAISLFLSVAIGLYIQNNRFVVENYEYVVFTVYDKLTGKTHSTYDNNH
jgi:hypothetical protein